MSEFLTAALWYLDNGWRPIPCRRSPDKELDKKPLVKWRDFQQRAPTRAEIEQWWRNWPDANVAVLTGFGVCVVDLDGPEAETLLHEHRVVFPDSAPRVKTGRGFHVYFRARSAVRNDAKILERDGSGVDFRGDGGYVLAPPSIHQSGHAYAWINRTDAPQRDELPLLPESFVFLLANTTRRAASTAPVDGVQGPGWVVELLRGVGEGQRDQSCARLAGYFVQLGLPNDVTTEILRQFGERCTPPFALSEVRKTVTSVERTHVAKSSERTGETDTGMERGTVVEHVRSVLAATLEEVRSGGTRRVKTGFPLLDDYLGGGYGQGELIYLGARSGVGKTSLALQMVVSSARHGHTGLIVSREMVNTALARRMLSQEGQIHAGALRRGTVSHWGDVEQAAQRLADLPLWLTDTALTVADIHAGIESIPGGVQFLLVDYLQLVRAPDLRKDRRLQVEAISQALKELALALKIPVLCVSSLSRQPNTGGEEKRPTLASLKESGELEYDADVVLLLHREMGKDYAECIVAKNRDGQTGTTALLFKSQFVSFVEVAAEHDHTDPDAGRYR